MAIYLFYTPSRLLQVPAVRLVGCCSRHEIGRWVHDSLSPEHSLPPRGRAPNQGDITANDFQVMLWGDEVWGGEGEERGSRCFSIPTQHAEVI